MSQIVFLIGPGGKSTCTIGDVEVKSECGDEVNDINLTPMSTSVGVQNQIFLIFPFFLVRRS